MISRLQSFWRERGQREKQLLAVLAVFVLLAAYAWLVMATLKARSDLSASLLQLRGQFAHLEKDAAEITALRQRPMTKTGSIDLKALAQTQAGAAGLTRSLQRADSASVNQIQVSFAAAAFSDWLTWLKGMQAQQLRLENCRLEALSSAPGLVSITASLSRASPQ